MRIITEPSVYILGRQTVDDGELNRFLADHGIAWESDSEVAAEVLTETAGRVCYMSFAKPRPGGNAAYLHHIKEAGHGSVLEHAVWTLLITGVSRSLSHELIRHRAGVSPSQLSQRYVDESVAEYVVPPDLRTEVAAAEKLFRDSWANPQFDTEECDCLLGNRKEPLTAAERAGVQWFAALAVAQLSYRRLATYLSEKVEDAALRCPVCGVKGPADSICPMHLRKRYLDRTTLRKAARQAARSVLPNATETKLVITANARALRNMLEQRCSRFAEPEIRQLFGKVWEFMVKESPNLFGDYVRVPLPDGTFELSTPFRKV